MNLEVSKHVGQATLLLLIDGANMVDDMYNNEHNGRVMHWEMELISEAV